MQGNDIMRGGLKIGYIESNHIFNHEGKKIGYVSGNMIFDHMAKKIAYLEGEFVYTVASSLKKVRIEDEIMNINAGLLSDVMRVAIKFFFGD